MKLFRSSFPWRLLYTGLLFFSACFYISWRTIRQREYRHRLKERFGFVNIEQAHYNGIWIHAVSVGETMAALPLVKSLRERHPDIPIILSSTTLTGAERVKELHPELKHIFFPWDFVHASKRALSRLRPRMLILLETEIWPNLIEACADASVPVLLMNARLSERSAKRYRYLQPMSKEVLGCLSAIGAQSESSAKRFEQLGTPAAKISVCGNLKFDHSAQRAVPGRAELLRHPYDYEQLLVAGSTHAGEEEVVLAAADALWKQFPKMLLALAPRHPERFKEVRTLCRKRKLAFSCYSRDDTYERDARVLLLDEMGCLANFLAISDIAYIGGSMVKVGGHNMFEAAAHGVPVFCGPHLFNFEDLANMLLESETLSIVHNADELAQGIASLLTERKKKEAIVRKTLKMVATQSGALDKHMALLAPFLR